jgi:hypothetical protein
MPAKDRILTALVIGMAKMKTLFKGIYEISLSSCATQKKRFVLIR